MERMDWLWIERGGRDMNEQRLRTQVQNIQKKKLLSDVEIGETWETGRAKDDVEALNEESHEVDGDLEAELKKNEM